MTTKHSQEQIISTYKYNGIEADLVEWKETLWCEKIGYAVNNTDEPDVEKVMNDFFTANASAAANEREDGWDVCISFNYLSEERPNGVMFGFLVGEENLYFPFSDSWRTAENRKADCTEKISSILKKLRG